MASFVKSLLNFILIYNFADIMRQNEEDQNQTQKMSLNQNEGQNVIHIIRT